MIDGSIFALVVIATAFMISGMLFDRQGDKSATVSATTGLMSNIIWMTVAVFMILAGGPSAIFGFLLLTIMLFLARGNFRILEESEVRAKIAGQ